MIFQNTGQKSIKKEFVKIFLSRFQISILRECETEFCHVCGGTIISPAWILTSAHCVSSVPLEEMGILMGDHNLYELSYEQKFVRAIEKVTHPGFFVCLK